MYTYTHGQLGYLSLTNDQSDQINIVKELLQCRVLKAYGVCERERGGGDGLALRGDYRR
jgi:hypothetical protein